MLHDLPPSDRPCWTCTHWDGWTEDGWGASWCLLWVHKGSGGRTTKTGPGQGCAFWEREPGTDDGAEPPVNPYARRLGTGTP